MSAHPTERDTEPRTRGSLYITMVSDDDGGLHGINVDPINAPPGSTCSVRRPTDDDADGQKFCLVITPPPGDRTS